MTQQARRPRAARKASAATAQTYFVTGATGFIGKFLLEQLLQRPGSTIYVLVRPGSEAKFEQLQQRFGDAGERLIAVSGDLGDPDLVGADARKALATRSPSQGAAVSADAARTIARLVVPRTETT